MGLIAGVLEEKGIRTVCLSNMEEIMGKVAPPRWLSLPFPLGYPLGRPNEPDLQRQILRQALRLLEDKGPGPLRVQFNPETER